MKKRILSVITSLLIIISITVTSFSLTVFASYVGDTVSDIFLDELVDNALYGDYTEDELTIEYYSLWYDLVLNNEYGSSLTMIDESTGTFSDEYLNEYEYWYGQFNAISNPIDWSDFCTYAKQRYLDENNSGEVSSETSAIITDKQETFKVTGETFADIVARLNEQYMPNAKSYISMRTDNRWTVSDGYMSFYADGVFCNQSDWTEVYILPFYYDGSQYYYGITSCHLYQTVETDDDGVNHVYIDYEFTKYFNSSWVDVGRFGGSANPIDFSSNRYMDISISSTASDFTTYLYSSYEAYLKKEKTGTTLLDWIDETDFAAVYPASGLANSDLSDRQVTYSFVNVVKASEQKDMGYFVSNEPLELYDGGLVTPIDSTKIDPEATVKMTGDTIYDYTITNTTGDTMTINEYVTNNYTYITNNGGDTSGDTGSFGNVNVTGTIGVGGQVDVNININQGSSTAEAYPYVDPNVNEALEQIPEMGDGFTGFIRRILDWLPPELLKLLLGGVGLAILCRLAGR